MGNQRASSSETDILLIREASMASMSLGLGLTHLRKYDFVQPGYFYSSMFSITIGLERLMKLIVIYDHRIKNNGAFPDNAQLKNEYGHKLTDLYNNAIQVNSSFGFDNDNDNDSDILHVDNIYRKIMVFLSDFATESRYYNLDTLTGKHQSHAEPLYRWNEEINPIILKRHYKPRKGKMDLITDISGKIEDITAVRFSSDSGNEIDSVMKLYLEGDQVPVKQKYSMYYIYVISRYLSKLLGALEVNGRFYPFLREYFRVFLCDDKSYIMRRKTWNPNTP